MTAASHVAAAGGSQFRNVAAAATTVVIGRSAVLRAIVVNAAVASGVITIYDHASAASGTKVATITHPATLLQNQYRLEYGAHCANGIVVVSDHNDDFTVIWD